MTAARPHQGKTSLGRLGGIPRLAWPRGAAVATDGPSLLSFEERGFRFDCLFHPRPGADRLFVLFSGDAPRKRYDPPVFQRWTWAPYFPGSCLYVSDPSLHVSRRLGLAWYAGTEAFDPIPVIADRADGLAAGLGIAPGRIYSYGSSGGGYAALRLAAERPGMAAIAVNPQTCITRYDHYKADRYLRMCFAGRDRETALAEFPRRLSLLENVDALSRSRILLMQNRLDRHHYFNHYKPLCAAMGTDYNHDPKADPVHRIIFSHEDGHKAAETQDVFDAAMDLVVQGAL